jgi:putative FmdB family regulatory protein
VPYYEYCCTECGHSFDLRQGFDAKSVAACPKCGKESRRRIHPVGVIYKGSGWYVTDYAKKNYDGPSGNGKEPETERPSEETKPPPKSEKVPGTSKATSNSDKE